MRIAASLLFVALLGSCGGREAKPVPPSGPSPAEVALDAAIETFYQPHLAFRPGFAIGLGYHQYDGKVPDRSAAALAAEIDRLGQAKQAFEAVTVAELPATKQLELELALGEIRHELFDLEVRRRPWRDPFYYVRGISLLPYIARDYAPLEQRAKAMLSACQAAPAYYQQADQNLEAKLPKAWLGVAAGSIKGSIEFTSKDAPAAFDALTDEALEAELDACLTELASHLAAFGEALARRMPEATDDYKLGGDAMLDMLRENEGIEIDLATLERIAREDLDRNLAAIAAAAAQIDPARDVRVVIDEVSADKPEPDQVIEEATAQVAALRRFVVEHDLVSIPRDEVAEVRASPPFMRGNFAALGGAGPFEPIAQPSFFYIAPPDPSWPEPEQRAYLPSRSDLLFITAHEVWPGHFIQGMHERASGNRMLQTFETYTTSEGWAHYVEEMMWDEGLGDRDPRAHIGQLKNALLRNVRFLVALGLHTGDMTIDQAVALFQEHAYADPGNARQQAMRGTLDPLFLAYTLGKLAIMKLRDDWKVRMGDAYTLRGFHDEFLRHGEAPLPVIRRLMLGDSAGPLF